MLRYGYGHDSVMAVLLASAVFRPLPAHPGKSVVFILIVPRFVRGGFLIRPLRPFYVKLIFYVFLEIFHGIPAYHPRLAFDVFIPCQAVRRAIPKPVIFLFRIIIVIQPLNRFIRSIVEHKRKFRNIPALILHFQGHGEQNVRDVFIIVVGTLRIRAPGICVIENQIIDARQRKQFQMLSEHPRIVGAIITVQRFVPVMMTPYIR